MWSVKSCCCSGGRQYQYSVALSSSLEKSFERLYYLRFTCSTHAPQIHLQLLHGRKGSMIRNYVERTTLFFVQLEILSCDFHQFPVSLLLRLKVFPKVLDTH